MSCASQAIVNGTAQAGLGKWLGNNQIKPQGIKTPHRREQVGGSFAQIAAGRKDLDGREAVGVRAGLEGQCSDS